MKDEIKEINIKTPGQILDYVDTKEHLLELFNYITNLQEENERLSREKIQRELCESLLEECDAHNKHLQEENQRLKKEQLNLKSELASMWECKARNEEAIEYIKNNCEYKNKGFIDEKMIIGDWFELKELLNILGGGDDND